MQTRRAGGGRGEWKVGGFKWGQANGACRATRTLAFISLRVWAEEGQDLTQVLTGPIQLLC